MIMVSELSVRFYTLFLYTSFESIIKITIMKAYTDTIVKMVTNPGKPRKFKTIICYKPVCNFTDSISHEPHFAPFKSNSVHDQILEGCVLLYL